MVLPYVVNSGNVKKFFDEIRTAPVPAKVDAVWLASRGYTGENDKKLIGLLKALGFIDSGGKPEERWRSHRHAGEEGRVRADGVISAFSGFFELYPDGQKRSQEEFANWARTEDPSASPTTIRRSWRTFETLVGLSDFGSGSSTAVKSSTAPPHAQPVQAQPVAPSEVRLGAVGGITVSIELKLPASADASFFDAFFSSLRRNLIDEHE